MCLTFPDYSEIYWALWNCGFTARFGAVSFEEKAICGVTPGQRWMEWSEHFPSRCTIGSWGRRNFGNYSRGCSQTASFVFEQSLSFVFEQSGSHFPALGVIILVTSAIFELCRL